MFRMLNGTFPTQQGMLRSKNLCSRQMPRGIFTCTFLLNSSELWTGRLRPLAFSGITQDCRQTMGRGPRQRECLDNGRISCWALESGHDHCWNTGVYEPWVHYTEKGQWINALWSAHKLPHSIYMWNMRFSDPLRCFLEQAFFSLHVSHASLSFATNTVMWDACDVSDVRREWSEWCDVWAVVWCDVMLWDVYEMWVMRDVVRCGGVKTP